VRWYFIKPYVKGFFTLTGFLAGKVFLLRPQWIEYSLRNRLILANIGFILFSFNIFIQVPNWYDIYYGFANFDDD
jgi:hypothetical protein